MRHGLWALVMVVSCGGGIVRLKPPLPQAHLTLGDACVPGEPVTCPREVFLRGLEEAALVYQDAELCRVDLQECRELGIIDQSMCSGQLQECEERASQRWIWGAAGAGLGALAVGLVFFLGGSS